MQVRVLRTVTTMSRKCRRIIEDKVMDYLIDKTTAMALKALESDFSPDTVGATVNGYVSRVLGKAFFARFLRSKQ